MQSTVHNFVQNAAVKANMKQKCDKNIAVLLSIYTWFDDV